MMSSAMLGAGATTADAFSGMGSPVPTNNNCFAAATETSTSSRGVTSHTLRVEILRRVLFSEQRSERREREREERTFVSEGCC